MASYYGDDSLGAFLPGLTKFVKKIGKITSPITTGIAKSFLPASLVNAAATIDPTRSQPKVSVTAAQTTAGPYTTTDKAQADAKKLPIPLIAAGAGVIILAIVLMTSKKAAA